MKKLVFGALISVLSASAFATVTHSMHNASTQFGITINSTGVDNCDASDLNNAMSYSGYAQQCTSGNCTTGLNKKGQVFNLNSLYYGQYFTICKKFKLEGWYPALRQSHSINLEGKIDTSEEVRNYLTNSGLYFSARMICKRKDNTQWDYMGGFNGTVAENMTGSINIIAPVQTGLDVLPKVCVVLFQFMDPNSGLQKKSKDSEIDMLDLDLVLDISIDNEL